MCKSQHVLLTKSILVWRVNIVRMEIYYRSDLLLICYCLKAAGETSRQADSGNRNSLKWKKQRKTFGKTKTRGNPS